MIKLGEKQEFKIIKKKDFGVYLGVETDSLESVLLPVKQVPEAADVGDSIEVFVYRDSMDRLIATTQSPHLCIGEVALLEVKEVTSIGAFLDWGLEKDLLLPFKEQTAELKAGNSYLVALYIDKSHRLCATMKIYEYLQTSAGYQKDDRVTGYVYQINENLGAFVAVDNKYHGLILINEIKNRHILNTTISARVVRVREDGKLELSLREKIDTQMDLDSVTIMKLLESYSGVLPFTEKAEPEIIARETGLSKAAFKRAVGRLLKQKKIEIVNGKIRKC